MWQKKKKKEGELLGQGRKDKMTDIPGLLCPREEKSQLLLQVQYWRTGTLDMGIGVRGVPS